jgi:transposase InsO family protein
LNGRFKGLIQPQRQLLFLLDKEGILGRMYEKDRVSSDPVVSFRLRAVLHSQKYGYRSAGDAFQISKSSLYRWQKAFLSSKRKAISLRRKSTKPHRFRAMQTAPEVVAYIRSLRESHYRLGKEKIKPLLDKYCFSYGLRPISVSTIGKIIKRYHLFYQRELKYRHNPNWKRSVVRVRLRAKHSWAPKELGHIQMDTVFKFMDGIKRYAISVMDIRSRFALTLIYPRLTSASALDTLIKFRLVYPVPLKSVQTDNGLEFQGVFDEYLVKRHIPHFFTYPRCPKINAYIERYNRTLQEEFLNQNLYLFHDLKLFHSKLLDYLLFFVTSRAHKALDNRSPMDFLISEGYFSQKSVTYTNS